MRNKRRPQSRQVRRAAARRRAKQLAQKGNQNGKEPQEPDQPKVKNNWRFGIDVGVRLLVPFMRDIVDHVKDFFQS